MLRLRKVLVKVGPRPDPAVFVACLQNVMPSTRAAIGAIAAALLVLSAAAPPAAADSPPITILDSGYTIDFGSAVHFFLDAAAAEAPITEIRARFKPHGPDTVWSYGYARFSVGNTVHAEFDIPTSGTAYYPPGVQFEVYFVVTDAAGNTLQTPPTQVEYLDPGLEWEHRTSGVLTAISYDLPPSTVDALLAAANDRFPAIMETVGLEDPREYRAILFSSTRNAEAFFPPVSETTRREHIFAGFAFTEYGLFVLARPRASMFVHELTHLVVAGASRSHVGRPVPAWLNEGLAVYFETASSPVSRGRVQTAAPRATRLRVPRLDGRPLDPHASSDPRIYPGRHRPRHHGSFSHAGRGDPGRRSGRRTNARRHRAGPAAFRRQRHDKHPHLRANRRGGRPLHRRRAGPMAKTPSPQALTSATPLPAKERVRAMSWVTS